MVHEDDTPAWLVERRERVFLVLASFFICSMTLLNVIGITRFVQLGPMALAIGVLPYPLTFLCTDLICELYGQRRANFMVSVGLGLNLFIFGVMTLGNMLPAAESTPPWQAIMLANEVGLPNGDVLKDSAELFTLLYACTSGAMFASMMAYIAAQYCDVKLFHFWKRLTKGKHLWLRNNFSTMISQLVDSITVITVTFWTAIASGDITMDGLMVLLMSNYFFKVVSALCDTPFFYFFTYKLRTYLQFESPEKTYAQ